MGGRTCDASWVALSTPVLLFCSPHIIFPSKFGSFPNEVVDKMFSRLGRRRNYCWKVVDKMSSGRGRRQTQRYFSVSATRKIFFAWGRSNNLFIIVSYKIYTNRRVLHWELFFNIRHHQYIYIVILALPRYPSFRFAKEKCVPANTKILEGPVTPEELHAACIKLLKMWCCRLCHIWSYSKNTAYIPLFFCSKIKLCPCE